MIEELLYIVITCNHINNKNCIGKDESVDDGCHDNGVDEDVDAPADPGGDHVNDGSIHQELEYSLHIEVILNSRIEKNENVYTELNHVLVL